MQIVARAENDIAYNRASRRQCARASSVKHYVVHAVSGKEQRVKRTLYKSERMRIGLECRMHSRLYIAVLLLGKGKQLYCVTKLLAKGNILYADI